MAICQNLIKDYLHKDGRCDKHGKELYSDRDLQVALDYAKRLKERGCKKEPFHHYDIDNFILWCDVQLEE